MKGKKRNAIILVLTATPIISGKTAETYTSCILPNIVYNSSACTNSLSGYTNKHYRRMKLFKWAGLFEYLDCLWQ